MKTLTRLTMFAAACLCAGSVMAASLSPQQKTEVEKIVRDYLVEHPEILDEMSKVLEQRQKVAQSQQLKDYLAENAKQVFRSPGDFVLGNPNGDKDLRIVLKEFPIFGEDSEYAARAALAAGKQGKYREMHLALFGFEGKVTKDVVDATAQSIGLDAKKLAADMGDAETQGVLSRNHQIAQSLSINGTPAFVIGDQLVPGYLPHDDLAAAVADVRKSGSCNKLC
jgi:protein-disulfide isomerase